MTVVYAKDRQLTEKQKAFARAVATGMPFTEAYRSVYNVNPKTATKVAGPAASKLAGDPRVQKMIEELRAPAVAKVGITLESHLEMLAKIRDAALADSKYSAAASAEIARGKAAGIQVERSVVTNLHKTLPASVDDFV